MIPSTDGDILDRKGDLLDGVSPEERRHASDHRSGVVVKAISDCQYCSQSQIKMGQLGLAANGQIILVHVSRFTFAFVVAAISLAKSPACRPEA